MEPLVRQLYGQAEGGRRRPTLAELSGAFQSACKAFVKVFVVTDALDESEHRVRRQFISSLDLTASPKRRPTINGPATYPDLRLSI